MEKRDLIEEQIEQLGKFLRGLLTKFIKLKSTASESESMEYVSLNFKTNFDIELNDFVHLSDEDFEKIVLNKKITEGNLEILSDLLSEISKLQSVNHDYSALLIKKAIFLLEFAEKKSNTFSIERNAKIAKLKNKLN